MFSFNRDRFFADLPIRCKIKLTPERRGGIEFLLTKFEGDLGFTMIRELAYVLATIQWETASTFLPIKERRFNAQKSPEAFKNQDRYWRTGFYGRGYVQLTWQKNYARVSKEFRGRTFTIGGAPITVQDDTFVQNPDYVLDPEVSYAVCSHGMRAGWFTGKKLGDYIAQGAAPDYKNARRIINGLDRADDIAAIASQYELVLRAASNA